MDIMFRLLILSFIGIFASASGSPPGWETWLSDNLNENDSVQIEWEAPEKVPPWLSGTYMKNCPGRSHFGIDASQKTYGNIIDGWAKIYKFHIDQKGVVMNSKFLKTPFYQKNERAGQLLPQTTVGPVHPKGWSIRHLVSILSKGINANTPVTIDRMGSEFIACTDAPGVNVFNASTLEWQEYYTPPFVSTASSAHWMKEPGTDHKLNFHIGLRQRKLKLYRYPNGDLRRPQLVGTALLDHPTLMHTFSVTPNYAIFSISPIHVNFGCVFRNLFQNLLGCVEWEPHKNTQIIVMCLKTGRVVSESHVDAMYSTHHVNAHESNHHSQIVVDLVTTPWQAVVNFTKTALLQSVDTGRISNSFQLARLTIDLTSNSTTVDSEWGKNASVPFISHFDFPVVNEKYQGFPYRFAYGQVLLDNVRQPLVKKDMADSTQDKVWFREHHYTTEPYFIPNPNATQEDDGVVLVIVMNGPTDTSYLLLLDGVTFETLTTAQLPDYIPISLHGNWFDGEFL